MGLLLGLPLSALPAPFGTWLPLAVSIFLGLGMMGLTVAKRDDLIVAAEAIGLFRRRDADGGADPLHPQPHIVVDTSVLIDGRVADIVESGFLYGTLVVPRFVLEELQHIADSSDTLRRNRGRRGLDILARMQKDSPTPILIVDDDVPDGEGGRREARRPRRARAAGRSSRTTSTSTRSPSCRGSACSTSTRSPTPSSRPCCPGEELHVRVIQEGKEPGQGVGFLDDGTMIVVEGGSRFIDRDLDVSVTRVLQTVAGRMIFAQPRLD